MRPPYVAHIALALGLWLAVAPAFAQPAAMARWDRDHPLKPGTMFGPLKVESVKDRPDPRWELGVNVATFIDRGGRRGQLAAVVAFDDVAATVGAGRVDPDSPESQVLLADYSGGAHCCTHVQLLDWTNGAWRVVDIGTFDGEPFVSFPMDVDGDGVADIVQPDSRFAYRFDCYACSWMPPRIFNVRRGQLIEVSAEPRYRKLFEADYAEAKDACGKPTAADSNAGYCAGVVADGVRLGRADEAWAFALGHLKTYDEDVLARCKIERTPQEPCPVEQLYTGKDAFRADVAKILAENGYGPPSR